MARAETRGGQDCGNLYLRMTEQSHTFDITGIIEMLRKKMEYRLFSFMYMLIKSWFLSQSPKCLWHISKTNIQISLLNFKNSLL